MDEQNAQKSVLKNPYLYSGIIFLAVLAYVAFILVARHESNVTYDRRSAERASKQQRAEDQAVIEQLGGSELAIRALYVSPKAIHPGEETR